MTVPLLCSIDDSASRVRKSIPTTTSTPFPTDVVSEPHYATEASPPDPSSTFLSVSAIDASSTTADRLVLINLIGDVNSQTPDLNDSNKAQGDSSGDDQTIEELTTLSNPKNQLVVPSVFTTWANTEFPPWIQTYIFKPYIQWASNVVRRPADVTLLTHILALSVIGLPNVVMLFVHFTYLRALLQWMLITYLVGPFSIIMHNHIHGRGIMSKRWALLDTMFPYVLGPMMGQTWNSFYYHHKHHHIEDNGPDDLSSTLRYQRDSGLDLAQYLGRFVFMTWLELPVYYIRKGMATTGLKFFFWEISSYAFIVLMARVNFAAAMSGLLLPLIQWRIAVMTNNWGQHAFIDQDEPSSNLRCSITLIDVVANRHGFNDGYHTTHHIIPARHWSEHPQAFMKMRQTLAKERALTFQKVDFVKLSYLLLRKEYAYIAKCLVPMGEQIGMSNDELADMLRKKTKRFSEEDIRIHFR